MLPERILENPEEQTRYALREQMATFANVDFQRTRFWCLASSVAIYVPRRLGPDASPRELSYDKKISRKMCHQYRVLWGLFYKDTEAPPPPSWSDWPLNFIDAQMRQIGTTVIWERQVEYLIRVVNSRIAQLDDLDEELLTAEGLRKWKGKHHTLLEWELAAMDRMQQAMQTKRPAV